MVHVVGCPLSTTRECTLYTHRQWRRRQRRQRQRRRPRHKWSAPSGQLRVVGSEWSVPLAQHQHLRRRSHPRFHQPPDCLPPLPAPQQWSCLTTSRDRTHPTSSWHSITLRKNRPLSETVKGSRTGRFHQPRLDPLDARLAKERESKVQETLARTFRQ